MKKLNKFILENVGEHLCMLIRCFFQRIIAHFLPTYFLHNVEYMNRNRLQQDHPCVVNYIRRHYLNSPAQRNVPLKLDYPEEKEPSEHGQPSVILDLLHNKVSYLLPYN